MDHFKKKLKKERKKWLKANEELQNKLEQLKNNILPYETVVLIHSRVSIAQKKLSCEYNEEFYYAQMRIKYTDADDYELREKSSHYKQWQYIIHFSTDNDYRINQLRAIFGDESKRIDCHHFCFSMRTISILVSSRAFPNIPVSNQKLMKAHLLRKNLEKFTRLYPCEINYVLRFLEINGDVN